ncbi:MAG: N-acetylmuramoyl-L-alanine amidase [Proteobacteria bacterium]|jgi:N-acetylmuramoyl-L-alanine amidase|nr:N-acetylmuramoyl-L-alanine amidase [Pseudomonadota bacterium]
MVRAILLTFSILLMALPASGKDVHVIIDAGHGGPADWGLTSTGFDEKTIDLMIAKKVQTLLEAEGDYEVVLSRIGDYPVTLNDRKKTSNQYPNSVYLSIHSSVYEQEPRVFTYVLKQVSAGQNTLLTPIEVVHGKSYKNSLKFAEILENEFPENMNHEIVFPKFPIASLVGLQSPAVLVECQCVSSNAQSTEANLDEFARNLVEGIIVFAKKVL